jgi:hypothetical protein
MVSDATPDLSCESTLTLKQGPGVEVHRTRLARLLPTEDLRLQR